MSRLIAHQVTRRGAGRPILFASGFGCGQNVWDPVAAALQWDHEVLTYDYAGSGRSDPGLYDRRRHGTLRGHADDLIEICREAGLSKTVLVAHSVGASIAILAAQREPALFDSLVLLAPSPTYLNHADFRGGFEVDDIEALLDTLDANHFGWARMMAPVIMGNADRPELAERLGDSFCRMEPGVARHFARVLFMADHRADLDGMPIPSVLLQCTDDALAAPAIGTYMAARMAGSQLVQLQASGHCPHMSAPDEVVGVLRRHLSAREALATALPA